jgi:ankyrin repeat protein
MPVRPLPQNPSLEHLRKQAKQLLEAARATTPAAMAQIREHHPRPPEALALHDAQLVIARSYGFASWPRLVHHLEGVACFTWDPMSAPEPANAADRLVRLACLDYGRWRPADLDAARRLLAEDPALARANVYTAAATGDLDAMRALLAEDGERAHAPGGPWGCPPLLYACYSRLAPTLDVARALLAAGADPDAGFLWCGNVPPFTALTGAFGEGEDGTHQPPHPQRDELARALLDAGADPNDGQTLYNRHFRRDDGHLTLLLAYGLGRDCGGPWLARFGDRIGTPRDLLVEELWVAARKNFADRARLLIAHGAPVDVPGRRDGRTPYEVALMFGNHEIARDLAAHGARQIEIPLAEQLASACLGGRRAEAEALLAAHPALRDTLGVHGRVELVRRAVEAGRPDGVRLLAALGFELGGAGHQTPMHDAAWAGDADMVSLLLALGADPEVRDPRFHATPLGWALYNQQPAVVAVLAPHASLFDAIRAGAVERVQALLEQDPRHDHALADARDRNGDPAVFSLHRGIARLAELIAVLRAHGADFTARDAQGRTLADVLQARGDGEVVAALGPAVGPPAPT